MGGYENFEQLTNCDDDNDATRFVNIQLLFFQLFEEHEINKVGSVVSGAVITSNGKLTPDFEYIAKLREENESTMTCPGDFNSEKKVCFESLYC